MKNREKLKHYFETYPNQPIEAATLSAIGGACAWRTRVSELRTKDGMVIDNEVRNIKTDSGILKVSEYTYRPAHAVRPTARAKRPAKFHGHKKQDSTPSQRPTTLPPPTSTGQPLTQPKLF